MSVSRPVTKDEFDAFIAAYPRPLTRDVARMCEPPMLSYNDFSEGKVWPESVVAKAKLNTDMRGHPAYSGEPDEYFLQGVPEHG